MGLNSDTHNITDFNDTEIVKACRKGDLNAFEWLVEKYQNVAFALALSYVPNFHDAQEIVQESFLNAYYKLVQLDDPTRFRNWLCAIIKNLCRSWLRKQTNTLLPLDESVQATVSRLSIQQERQERLRSSIWAEVDALPEKYRMVILLYYMNDYSYREMSELLDLPVSTVKGRLQQARIKLKREFHPADKEELKMGRVNSEFSKRVRLAACQIATEPVKESVSFEGMEHLVLFCGIHTDIELRQHDKETVEIIGTKYSLGNKARDAQESVSKIQFYIDITKDYWQDGPHEVERFSGTDTTNRDCPSAIFIAAMDLWRMIRKELTEEREPASSILHDALKNAVRITVGRQNGEDILLSLDAYTDEIQRIFSANYNDEEQLHGSVGCASLVVYIPVGKYLTLIKGRKIDICGVKNDVNLISCSLATIENMKGTACLYDTYLSHANCLKGRFVQYFHRFGGGNTGNPYCSKRTGSGYETRLQNITGEVHVDAGRMLIEASEMEGKTFISNRFGTTRLYQKKPRTDGVCKLQSSSGDILLFLSDKSIGKVSIAAKTLCGEIDYGGVREMSFPRKWNNPHEMYVGTVKESEMADIQIQTESGNIRMEKMAMGC